MLPSEASETMVAEAPLNWFALARDTNHSFISATELSKDSRLSLGEIGRGVENLGIKNRLALH